MAVKIVNEREMQTTTFSELEIGETFLNDRMLWMKTTEHIVDINQDGNPDPVEKVNAVTLETGGSYWFAPHELVEVVDLEIRIK